MKQVAVLIGAGSIGQAIVRRVAAGKHVVLADYSEQNAATAAKTLEDAGFECSTLRVDLGSKDDILTLVREAQKYGEVTNLINAAGVSPSQASVEEILRVDMVGTATLLEEFGKVMAEGLPVLKAMQRTALGALSLALLFWWPYQEGDGVDGHSYIHKHIIDATKELLADPDRSITDVSYQIGFQYPQHLSRMFKKETGMTPAQYRKQITA